MSISRVILAYTLIVSSFSYAMEKPMATSAQQAGQKKKIIIFSSTGGGGHTSASQALTENLNSDVYEAHVVNIFDEILYPLDPIRKITGGKISGESLYNLCLTNNFMQAAKLITAIGTTWGPVIKQDTVNLIKKYLNEHRPDLVISLIPMINGAISQATLENNISFLIIPTDFDVSTFTFGLDANNNAIKITLPFDNPAMQKGLQPELAGSTVLTGFPLRKSFEMPKDPLLLKNKYSIPLNKKVLLLMMGAAGSERIIDYLKVIAEYPHPLHIIVCIGRNSALKEQIASIKMHLNTTMTITGTTPNIADFMALADMCLIKPGSVSVCEAIWSSLPMLLDGTGTLLEWEKFNGEMIHNQGFGTIVSNYQDVNSLLECYLYNDAKNACKINLEKYQKPMFSKNVNILIGTLLQTT